MIHWISGPWGIAPHNWVLEKRAGQSKCRRVSLLMFGDDDCAAVSGVFRTGRRAKKEITHYLNQGIKAAHHGAKRRSK